MKKKVCKNKKIRGNVVLTFSFETTAARMMNASAFGNVDGYSIPIIIKFVNKKLPRIR